MITKGIIEKVVSDYSYLVRIPILNKVKSAAMYTPTDELAEAVACIFAGSFPHYQINDVVFVAFEDNDTGKPIILGLLYRENMPLTSNDIIADSVNVNVSTKLPEDTTIGEVTGTEISQLSGITDNIQWQIDKVASSVQDSSAIRTAVNELSRSSGWIDITRKNYNNVDIDVGNYCIIGGIAFVNIFYNISSIYASGTTITSDYFYLPVYLDATTEEHFNAIIENTDSQEVLGYATLMNANKKTKITIYTAISDNMKTVKCSFCYPILPVNNDYEFDDSVLTIYNAIYSENQGVVTIA